MNDYFIWKGVSCADKGICVLEQPPYTLPKERLTFTDVPGRSGALTRRQDEDGEVYDDIILEPKCIIKDVRNVQELFNYLRGSGQVTFPTRPEGYYEASIINQIPLDKVMRGRPHRKFSVQFRCKPFLHLRVCADITVSQSLTAVTNPFPISSRPLIKVNGSGDITLMIGTQIVELEDVDGHIMLDCEMQEAYKGDTLLNGSMTGKFPRLLPGVNYVSWSGTVTSVVISPRWRTI